VSRPAIPFGDRITPLLQARVQVLYQNLPRALAGDEEPIHEIRVSGRRLRAALPLMAPKPQGRRVRRAIRTLKEIVRAAGRSRDLDVSIALFERRLSKAPRRPDEALLLKRLKAARARSRVRIGGSLLDLDMAALRRDLREVLLRGGAPLVVVRERLGIDRGREGPEVIQEIQSLGARFEPVELHRLRRRIRLMRYLTEVGASIGDDPAESPKELKALQDQLGLVHDAHVLGVWLESQERSATKAGRPQLAAAAARARRAFLLMARGRHREFLGAQPADVIRRALRLEEARDTAVS